MLHTSRFPVPSAMVLWYWKLIATSSVASFRTTILLDCTLIVLEVVGVVVVVVVVVVLVVFAFAIANAVSIPFSFMTSHSFVLEFLIFNHIPACLIILLSSVMFVS